MNAKNFILRQAIGAICLALGLPATAQTLAETCRAAQAQDAQFAIAKASYQASLEKLPQARAGLLPTLSLTASQVDQTGQASFSDAPYIQRSPGSWSWSVQLTQPVFRYANWAAYRQADAQLEQAQAQLQGALQELLVRCAQAYFDLVIAREGVSVMDAQINSTQQQLVLAQRNFEVGTGPVTDVHEVRAKQAANEAQRIGALNDLLNKQAELEKLLGSPQNIAPVKIAGALPALANSNVDEWRTRASAQNPQVKSQEAALEVARKEVSKNKALHAPTLDLTVTQSTNYSGGTLSSPADLTSRVNSSQVGLQLNIPIFSGGASQSRVREAIAQMEKANAELTNAKRIAETQARQAFWGVVNGEAQTVALVQAVESAKSALEGNRIGYRVGTRINPDVLSAEQQLYMAERDLSKARAETVMQSLKLKAVAGLLQESDLALIELLLEPIK